MPFGWLFFFSIGCSLSFTSRTLRSLADHSRGNDVTNCSLVIEIDSWHCYSENGGTAAGQPVTAAWLLDFIPRVERELSDRNMQIQSSANKEMSLFMVRRKPLKVISNQFALQTPPCGAAKCWCLFFFPFFSPIQYFWSSCWDFLSPHNSVWNRCCSWNCSRFCQTLLCCSDTRRKMLELCTDRACGQYSGLSLRSKGAGLVAGGGMQGKWD